VSSARQLVVLLASRGTALVRAVAEAVGPDATRRTLVDAYASLLRVEPGHKLASVAALVDRLERGVRLM
jgi:hypothetical protein